MKQRKVIAILAMILVLVLCVGVFAACNKDENPGPSDSAAKPWEDGKTYSYRVGPSSLPTSWNYHTYQANDATYILDYASDTLYTFDYNADKTGYTIVPSMAAGAFSDVTSEYVGQYGIKQGDENKVYSIPLKHNLKFDNGDAITANTFVESMKLLLEPKAANFRADNVYKSGNLKIYNAENYVKQNTYAYSNLLSADLEASEYIAISDFATDKDGYYTLNGSDLVVNINDAGNWGSNGLAVYAQYGYLFVETLTDDGYAQYADEKGNVVVYRKDVEEGEETVSYYYANDKETPVYADENGVFYSDAECTKMIEGGDSLSVVGTNGQYDVLAENANKDGYVKLNATTLKALQDCIAVLHGFKNVEAYAANTTTKVGKNGDINYAYVECEEMIQLGKFYDKLAYDGNVGFFAKDDYTLVIVLVQPMEDNFYLRYELCSSFFLVHPNTYKSCISESQGAYQNNYATSVDTFVGYGPYKLTQYVADSTIVLERNMNWHGYSEEEYKSGTYQTDRLVYTQVTSDATRLEMFLKGELDSYGLTEADMKDYVSSDYIYYTDSESTWYMAMNPDKANLEKNQASATPVNAGNKVIKTVLSIDEFRQAMSWSLDRAAFIQVMSPTSGIAKALLSSMIIADPDTGRTYRDLDTAKDAILEYWGLSNSWGEGKEYPTRDAAINSITGYDPAGAKNLFNAAYTKAKTQGLITEEDEKSGKWEIQIVIGRPTASTLWEKCYEFLKTNWTNAVVGTSFEGHVTFKHSQVLGSSTFGNYLRNGSVDLLYGVGYGGSMFDPYSMMDCFTGSLQYDVFTDTSKVNLDITIDLGDGVKTYRASLQDWVSKCLLGTEIKLTVIVDGNATTETKIFQAGTSVDSSIRTTILAKCETKIMTLSNIFPLMTDATAALKGMRLQYETEEYILGMGRGGMQYYNYAMDDTEFANYVASQGGTLNYK